MRATARTGCRGRRLLTNRAGVCCRLLRPLSPHLRLQCRAQQGGVLHKADAAVRMLFCGLLAQKEGRCSRVSAPRHACSVSSVRFSGDGLYVFSGSEDMNLRIWKANASRQLGTVRPTPLQKANAVLRLTQHAGPVSRASPVRGRRLLSMRPWFRATHTCPRSSALHGAALSDPLLLSWLRTHRAAPLRQRHVPKAIHKASQLRHTMEESQRVKRDNVAKHSAPGTVAVRPARKERIVAELH